MKRKSKFKANLEKGNSISISSKDREYEEDKRIAKGSIGCAVFLGGAIILAASQNEMLSNQNILFIGGIILLVVGGWMGISGSASRTASGGSDGGGGGGGCGGCGGGCGGCGGGG